jgi:septation ring formation regulator EzrA
MKKIDKKLKELNIKRKKIEKQLVEAWGKYEVIEHKVAKLDKMLCNAEKKIENFKKRNKCQ